MDKEIIYKFILLVSSNDLRFRVPLGDFVEGIEGVLNTVMMYV